MQMRMYQLKLTEDLLLSHGYEHVSSLVRWNRLYIDTKILLSQTAYFLIYLYIYIYIYKHPAAMSP